MFFSPKMTVLSCFYDLNHAKRNLKSLFLVCFGHKNGSKVYQLCHVCQLYHGTITVFLLPVGTGSNATVTW